MLSKLQSNIETYTKPTIDIYVDSFVCKPTLFSGWEHFSAVNGDLIAFIPSAVQRKCAYIIFI